MTDLQLLEPIIVGMNGVYINCGPALQHDGFYIDETKNRMSIKSQMWMSGSLNPAFFGLCDSEIYAGYERGCMASDHSNNDIMAMCMGL